MIRNCRGVAIVFCYLAFAGGPARIAEAKGYVAYISDSPASASPSVVISTVYNVVYARNYPVSGAQTGLDTAAQAGIGVGAGMGALAGVGLASWLWVRRRKRRERSMYPTGGPSLLQSHSGSTP